MQQILQQSEPAALGRDIVLELPAPPSVNAIIGTKLGNSHSKVQRWRRAADAHLIYTGQHRKVGNPIVGDFTIDIIFDRIVRSHRRGDLDNRIKALLDYCEHLRVIENDGKCDGITANWGRVPAGCRLTLRPREW